MIALVSFFIVLVVSLIIVRVASTALTLTGLSQEAARFQARSAWTGTGFTTAESERIVAHPVRRRIVTMLMVLRGAGFVTAIATLFLSFTTVQDDASQLRNIFIVLGVLITIWFVARSPFVDRRIENMIRRALVRFTDIEVRDYAALLNLAKGYAVAEVQVREDDWISGRTLSEVDLPEEGVLVLGIQRSAGPYLGAPRGKMRIHPGDTVMLYGKREILKAIDERGPGWEGERDRLVARRAHAAQQAAEEREDVSAGDENEHDQLAERAEGSG